MTSTSWATDLAFWVFAAAAIWTGWRVFRVDSMVRATFSLMLSFFNVGAILVLLFAEYLGVALFFMMAVEMTVMAIFMVAFMMNPAGLNPMQMVHQEKVAIGAGVLVGVGLTAVALLADLPGQPLTAPEMTIRSLGHELMGGSMMLMESVGLTLLATIIGGVVLSSTRGRHGDAHAGSRPPVMDPATGRSAADEPEAAGGHGGHGDHGGHARPRRSRGARMSLESVLVVAAVLLGTGVWGALSQQSFVMLMMGIELAINGVMLAAAGFWYFAAGGPPDGQVLVIVAMFVMAIEAAVGFALVVAVYRARQADTTEAIDSMKH